MLDLRHPSMLAPMEGVTHPVFRALIGERGSVGVLSTEFVRISRAPISARSLREEVVPFEGVPLSVQVMGNEAEKMAEAAAVMADAGAAIVDINLGCPMPRAVRKGVGAAMLKDLELLRRVLDAMRAATPVLLSAKIRAGFDDADHVLKIAQTVEAAGVDFLTVHPRRRCDFYEGVADWRIIRTLTDALSIPVVGNGDVWYASAALRMMEETGASAVMFGRPALRNPWIFSQFASLRIGETPHAPDGDEVCRYISDVAERYQDAFDRRAIGRLKEMMRYLGRTVPGERDALRALFRETELASFVGGCHALFAGKASHELDLDAEGSFGIEACGSAKLVDDPSEADLPLDTCASHRS